MSALVLPQLRPDQWAIACHPAKTKVIAAGRRYGKTTMAGGICLATANAGGRVGWGVPTYKNARPVWRWAEAVCLPLEREGVVRINRTERVIDFPRTGGFFGVYTCDSDVAIRGEWFNLFVLEEAARIREETYTEVVRPTLADYDGDALLISTPFGRNWFWREWERGRARMDAEIAAFRAPTTENPMPSIRKAAEMAQDRVPERVYSQEWLAEFLEDGGEIFRHVRRAAVGRVLPGPEEGHRYVMGVDLARRTDFTVCVVLDQDAKAVVAIDRFNQIDWSFQVARIKALALHFRVEAVIVDQTGVGDPIVQQLQRELSDANPLGGE